MVGLDDTSPEDILYQRNARAVEKVRESIAEDSAFTECDPKDDAVFSNASALWSVEITSDGNLYEVLIALPNNFPDDPPKARIKGDESLLLENPHVLENGLLCIIPDSAAINSSDPVGLFRYVYTSSSKIIAGTTDDDFREEFSPYWDRTISDDSKSVLVLDPIEELGSSFPVIFLKNLVFISSSADRLNAWIKNRFGNETNFKSRRQGIRLLLDRPLIPSEFPHTLADLVDLAKNNDTSAKDLILRHIVDSGGENLVLLEQKEGDGLSLGGIVFKGHKLRNRKVKGFRLGKIPNTILWNSQKKRIGKSEISRCKVSRVDHRWIHSRGGDGRLLMDKSVLLIGCGALGGYVAHLLARAGVEKLTITDNDKLGWENVGRHILGSESVGQWKANALKEKLGRELPHLTIRGIAKDWRDALNDDSRLMEGHDLIISTVADWRCEGPLNFFVRKQSVGPLIFGWLEPHAVAGHALFVSDKGGCFECGMSKYGLFERRVAEFSEETLAKEPGGCAYYQRYGPAALMPVATLIATVALESLEEKPKVSRLNTWISTENHFTSTGAEIRPEWKGKVANAGTIVTEWPGLEDCSVCK